MENILKMTLGIFDTNCYILKRNKHVLIIDPGKYPERIIQSIHDDEIVDGIVLTHGHFDHIGAVDDLMDHYHIPVYLNPEDYKLLGDEHNIIYGYTGTITHPIEALKIGSNTVGTFTFDVYSTPGHTDGSVVLVFNQLMFTGDTLFKGTIGRTDMFNGNPAKMEKSLQFLKSFGPYYTLYPGHGPITTMKEELLTNPYLR